MKTKVFTFILLALTMISYSSCNSDDHAINNMVNSSFPSEKEKLRIVEIFDGAVFKNINSDDNTHVILKKTSMSILYTSIIYLSPADVDNERNQKELGLLLFLKNSGGPSSFRVIDRNTLEDLRIPTGDVWKRVY